MYIVDATMQFVDDIDHSTFLFLFLMNTEKSASVFWNWIIKINNFWSNKKDPEPQSQANPLKRSTTRTQPILKYRKRHLTSQRISIFYCHFYHYDDDMIYKRWHLLHLIKKTKRIWIWRNLISFQVFVQSSLKLC